MKRGRKTPVDSGDEQRLDAIEGWPLPDATAIWLGDPVAERTLLEAYRSGRMHHAWLICGPKGIGKATLAYRFARFALAHPDPASAAAKDAADLSVDPAHPAFRKVAAGAHPNLLVLQRGYNDERKRFYTELTVDQIRRTVSFFGSTSGEPGWRIAIVDPADDMNASAANALLKILEEPPARSLFLIVSHAPGRLVPTIRSRCRRLSVKPLADTVIASMIKERMPDIEEAELTMAATLAEGSLRQAIRLIEAGGVEAHRELTGLLSRLPEIDIDAMHRLAERAGARGDDEAFDAFVEGLGAWLDRRLRGAEEPDAASQPGPAVTGAPLETWPEVWENLRRSADLTEELNLDRRQAVLSVLMNLARATRM